MIVIKRSNKGYDQDPIKYFNFSRFADECGDFVLIDSAFDSSDNWQKFELNDRERSAVAEKKVVRLEFEEPNKFFVGNDIESYDGQFHRIYTICPFTSEWLNKRQISARREPIFFPFNENDIPPARNKQTDVIYTGHLVSETLVRDIESIREFGYRLVSNTNHPLVTDHAVDYRRKLELISQSRICLVHNLLYPTVDHVLKIRSYRGWTGNHAFMRVPRRWQFWRSLNDPTIVVPQLKSRAFEAAFCRSLILCKYDDFRVIERFFEPDKEFVYFHEGTLHRKVREILNDFDKYKAVIENAFKRAIENYTTRAFVDQYLKRL